MLTLYRCLSCGDLGSTAFTQRRSGPLGLRNDDYESDGSEENLFDEHVDHSEEAVFM